MPRHGFPATRRQVDPRLRRGQSQERGLARRPACWPRRGPKSCTSSAAPSGASRCKLLVGDAPVFVCDVEFEDQIDRLARRAGRDATTAFHGLVHSIAFADYEGGCKPFHETPKSELSAGGRYLLLLADRAGQRAQGLARPRTPRS